MSFSQRSSLRSSSSIRSAADESGTPNLGALGRWLRKASANAGTDTKGNPFVADVTTELSVTLGQFADAIMENPAICSFDKVGIKSDGQSRTYTLEQAPLAFDSNPIRQPYKAIDKQSAIEGKATPLAAIFYRKSMMIAAIGVALGMPENDIFKLSGKGDYSTQRMNLSDDEVLTQYLAQIQKYIAMHEADPAMAVKCEQAKRFIAAFSHYLTTMPQIDTTPGVSISKEQYDIAVVDDQKLWKANIRLIDGASPKARVAAEIIETEYTFRQSMAIVTTKMAGLPPKAITPAIQKYLALCEQLANNQNPMGVATSKSAGELMQRGNAGHPDAVLVQIAGTMLDRNSNLQGDLQTMAACMQLYAAVQSDIHRLLADTKMRELYTNTAKSDGDTLDFESRLIQAIQRAPRYVLLTRDLAKQLPDGNIKASVLDAHLAIAAKIDIANNEKAKTEDMADMNAAVEKFQKWGTSSDRKKHIAMDVIFMGVQNGTALDRHHYFEQRLIPALDSMCAGLTDKDKATLQLHINELAKCVKIAAKTEVKERIAHAKAKIQTMADNPQKQAYVRDLIIGYNATDQATAVDRFNFLTSALQSLATHPTFTDTEKDNFRQAIGILLSHTEALAKLQGLGDELPSLKAKGAAVLPPPPLPLSLTKEQLDTLEKNRVIPPILPPTPISTRTLSYKPGGTTPHLVELPEGRGGYRRIRVETAPSSSREAPQKPPKPSPLTASTTASTDTNETPPASPKLK